MNKSKQNKLIKNNNKNNKNVKNKINKTFMCFSCFYFIFLLFFYLFFSLFFSFIVFYFLFFIFRQSSYRQLQTITSKQMHSSAVRKLHSTRETYGSLSRLFHDFLDFTHNIFIAWEQKYSMDICSFVTFSRSLTIGSRGSSGGRCPSTPRRCRRDRVTLVQTYRSQEECEQCCLNVPLTNSVSRSVLLLSVHSVIYTP